MKLSNIVKNLNDYYQKGKGYGRTYLYGDRTEITLLQHFIASRTVANSDPDISFIEFFQYLKNLNQGHVFSCSDFIWGSTRASWTMIFYPWINELSKDQKLNLVTKSSEAHALRHENRSYIYKFFSAASEYIPESNASYSNNGWFGNGMRF